MKLLRSGITEKYRIEICFVNLIILLYLFRTAIPLLKFPFLLLYFGFIVYSFIYYNKRIISTLIEFVRDYYLLLLLALILVISFLISNKLYLTIFKDVVNMLILLSIFFISTFVVSGKKEFNYYVSNLVSLIVFVAFAISILELLDLLYIFPNIDSFLNNAMAGNSTVDPFLIDYNFALLASFFGIFGVFYFLQKTNSKLQKIYYNFLLVIFPLNIILSGSRRGMIILLAIFLILTITKFIMLFKKNNFLKELGSHSGFFLLSLISLTILLYLFLFHVSFKFKTQAFEYIGTKNVITAKTKISTKIFRYISAINKNASFSEFHERIWNEILDSRDPDTGWGTDRIHKTVFPLTGENVEIVPGIAKGYLMDSTCNASYYPENDLCESFSLVVNLKVNKGDRIKASAYCFVSDVFDVNTASFGVGSVCISKNIVFGKVNSLYDLKRKGIWQKLEVEFVCNEGEVPFYLSFWKKGVKDFSKLKGYIIFAYPHYERINGKDNGLSLSITQSKSEYTESGIIDIAKNGIDLKYNELINQFPGILNTNKSYIKSYNKVIRRSLIPSITVTPNTLQYSSSGIFCFPFSILLPLGSFQNDHDPIRNLASKFISEDTTYYPYKANIVLDTISNQLLESRLVRWQFAGQIFTKEYTWTEKIFGGGFNFLNWYGYYFLKDKTKSDYPHNPFLYILLYSGVLGLIIYCLLLYKVFYYYIKYRKEYPLLFIFFLITFFFTFFSGGSPFDPPIMGFFSILPFFIHSVYERERKRKQLLKSEKEKNGVLD